MALEMSLEFRSIDEPGLGEHWRACFTESWPAYRRWFLSEGEAARPTYRQALRALRRHMPEFLPSYQRMTDLAGGGDFAARFLAQYCPPPFFAACSQAILAGDEPVLVRNYDFSPLLCDGLIMRTLWGDRAVISMSDCMNGILDGMNDSGLAVSLAFGGRRVVGEGFGITLVQRYLLETCDTVAEACAVLRRVPVQAAYNVALVDREGDFATVMLSPDRKPRVTKQRVSTNHQPGKRWDSYVQVIESEARFDFLDERILGDAGTPEALFDLFLQPPLFRDSYALGYGTIFTSAYFPLRGEMHCRWQDSSWVGCFTDFPELAQQVVFRDPAASPHQAPVWPQPYREGVHPGPAFIAH